MYPSTVAARIMKETLLINHIRHLPQNQQYDNDGITMSEIGGHSDSVPSCDVAPPRVPFRVLGGQVVMLLEYGVVGGRNFLRPYK
jgi:hypothetical protein